MVSIFAQNILDFSGDDKLYCGERISLPIVSW
jgi:hypothetical protein